MDHNRSSPEESYGQLLRFLSSLMTLYCDKEIKTYALSHVPLELINHNVNLRIRGLSLSFRKNCHPFLMELIYLKELVTWFKNDFFRRMEHPSCSKCKKRMGCVDKITSKKNELFCTFVELYECSHCGNSDFLNRFVDPRILLMAREGRCSEFSLCFTLICLSLGMRARYVVDLSDHCWTEVYSPYRHYWIHVDPSEGIVNQPLLYESGWGKKLSYIFSVGETDIQDVTWRYSSNHQLILARRSGINNHFIDELSNIRYGLLKELSFHCVVKELLLVIEELAGLLIENKPSGLYKTRISGVS